MTVWVRKGTAIKTPRKASASDHSISCHQGNTIGPPAGFCCLFIIPSAGTMPTSPARSWCHLVAWILNVKQDMTSHRLHSSSGHSLSQKAKPTANPRLHKLILHSCGSIPAGPDSMQGTTTNHISPWGTEGASSWPTSYPWSPTQLE